MAFRWRADDDPTLIDGLVALLFSGIRTSITKKPYILRFYRGGGGLDPLPPVPPLDTPMSKGAIIPDTFEISSTVAPESFAINPMMEKTTSPE